MLKPASPDWREIPWERAFAAARPSVPHPLRRRSLEAISDSKRA